MRTILLTGFLVSMLAACVPTNQFREVNDTKNEVQQERDELFAENERLTVENTEMKATIDEVKAQKEQFREDSIKLAGEINLARKDIAALQRKYNDLESTHESLIRGKAQETQRLLNELQSVREDLAKKERLLNNLQGDLNTQRQSLSSLNNELEAKKARLSELEQLLANKDAILRDLKKTVSDALLGFEGQGLTVTQKNGKVYVSLQNQLLFSSGSTDVDQKGQQALRQLGVVLAKNPDINIMIEGHTDDVPFRKGSSIKDNWDLSVLRATSIVRILLGSADIDPKRITVAGRGEYLPVDPADSPEARSKNRRTEIILSPNLDELYKILDM